MVRDVQVTLESGIHQKYVYIYSFITHLYIHTYIYIYIYCLYKYMYIINAHVKCILYIHSIYIYGFVCVGVSVLRSISQDSGIPFIHINSHLIRGRGKSIL